jgi:predicted HTH domain antitoxin
MQTELPALAAISLKSAIILIKKRRQPLTETTATIEIPRHLLQAARATPNELKVELALQLYQQRRLSIGHARELANMSLWEFRQLLASRRIPPHYDEQDLEDDLRTWRELDDR